MSTSPRNSSSSGSEKSLGKKGLQPVISTVQAVEQNDHWTASSVSEEQLELIYSHLDDKPFEEWLEILRQAIKYHYKDPLLLPAKYDFLADVAEGPLPGQTEEEWEGLVSFEAFVIHEWSIYPEVRNATVPIDEDSPEDYVNLRVYVISCVWALCGAVVDTFFAPRSPSISISTTALQILIALCGQAWALLPRITVPIWRGKHFTINNGKPWSFKEQMLATLGVAVAAGAPYSQAVVITQGSDWYYGLENANTFGYMITLTMSTAFMGFGFAGIFRSLLVYPSRMAWFSELSLLPLARSLVQRDVRENVHGWKLKRGEFFGLVALISFCWYWIVTILLPFLSLFDWMCYIRPDNVNINAVTGLWTGLGVNPFPSFDLSIIGFGGILTPVYVYLNMWAGILIGMIAVLIIWYRNVLNTGYFPIGSNVLYDNRAHSYNTSRVLNSEMTLDEDAYQNYSLPYWSAYNVVSYGAFFLLYPLAFVDALLNHYETIWRGLKTMFDGFNFWKPHRSLDLFQDSFSRRQQRYKEVPEYAFLIILICAFAMGIGCVEGYKFTDTPVWSIVLGIGLAMVFIPISGILYAVTGSSFETNVLFELIMGYAEPGHPQTILVSKCFATNFFGQADNWISNQKIAHYSGISPLAIFGLQCITTLFTCFVQCGIMTWQLEGGIPDMCDPKNRKFFSCQGARTYFNASVVWGVIGPKRVFKGLYPAMKWCFLIGACVPFPLFFWRKFGPLIAKRSTIKPRSALYRFVSGEFLIYVNEVLIATSALGPLISTTFADYWIHLLFQFYIRPRFPRWWTKYAYLLLAAINIGTAWAGFFCFWATDYNHIVTLDSWTVNVAYENIDYNYEAVRKVLPKGEYFGPRKGHFPN